MSKNTPELRFPEFKGEWGKSTLSDLSENGFSNGVFNDPKKVGKGYRLINVKDMYVGDIINVNTLTLVDINEKEFVRNKVEYGDILFTRSSLVKEGIAHSNVNLSNAHDLTFDGHLIRMRPDKSVSSPSFLAYNFTLPKIRAQFIKRGKTTTMTTIGQEDIGSVEICIPNLQEQTRIATFLTTVDEKLTQLKKKKVLLEQYKNGVMQKIFTMSELGFSGLEDERIVGKEEKNLTIHQSYASKFRLRFKDENGKEFPEWEEKKLIEIAEIIGGGTPDTFDRKFWNGEIDWFTPTELKTKYVSESIRKISIEGLQQSSAKILPKGTVLFTSRATVGDISIALKECSTNQGFQSFIVSNKCNNEFLYYWIGNNKNEFLKRASGSTFLEISKGEISKIVIQIPCTAEQTKIANFLSAIDEKIEHCCKQIERTEQWKKGLLQKMFV